jgi:hypothetical protein
MYALKKAYTWPVRYDGYLNGADIGIERYGAA